MTPNHDTPKTTPERSSEGRRFAKRYREEETEVSPNEVSQRRFKKEIAIDISYETSQGTVRTVRARTPSSPTSYDDVSEEFLIFWHDGERYAYNPEKRILKSINSGGRDVTLAEGDSIRSLTEIQYPTRAVVVGAVQDGITARVFYRSNQSDQIKTMDVEIAESAGRLSAGEITGMAGGRRVRMLTQWEREIETVGSQSHSLGRVVRVEFPRGHRYTINVHGLEDSQAELTEDRIKRAVAKSVGTSDVEVEVEHNGRMPTDE